MLAWPAAHAAGLDRALVASHREARDGERAVARHAGAEKREPLAGPGAARSRVGPLWRDGRGAWRRGQKWRRAGKNEDDEDDEGARHVAPLIRIAREAGPEICSRFQPGTFSPKTRARPVAVMTTS